MSTNPSVALPDDAALRAIVEGVESETGDRFFASLCRSLAQALDVQYAFVTQLAADGASFKMLAVWERDHFGVNQEFSSRGTPCESVLQGEIAHYPQGLRAVFPEDQALVDWGAESYSGVPVLDAEGRVFGHVAILDNEPMPDGPRGIAVMRIFAARVRAEIERLRVENQLRESGERLARILDSAMDAIVTFDGSGRIELFNRAAEKVFKCGADSAIAGPLARFLTEDLRRAVESAMQAMVCGQTTHSFLLGRTQLCALRADGERFPIEATISYADGAFSLASTRRGREHRPEPTAGANTPPAWNAAQAGQRRLFTLILRDIDERRRAEEELRHLSLHNEYLQEEIKAEHNFDEIVGGSPALSAALDKVRLVAGTGSTVLILGETGTGKELIARAIHSSSARRDRALIKVNCAALPAGLIESELFGHEKGAFTGATEKRIGRFELANGGTIFLDEIGEIPPEVQVKLLRVLQEREFERIGGRGTVKVDIRIIAATNRDLNRAAAEGKFRQDLFYRLNVFPIVIPPLRERREDIALLVHYFVRRCSARIGRKIDRIPVAAMARMAAYSWPGNIRELENVIERAVILSAGAELELAAELIPPVPAPSTNAILVQAGSHRSGNGYTPAASRSLADTEKEHIVAVLKQANWRLAQPDEETRCRAQPRRHLAVPRYLMAARPAACARQQKALFFRVFPHVWSRHARCSSRLA
jgi:PAS domain S-box-containing protein